ncbi:MAG: ECF-type sigma factor [Sedimentisphaerales bacterium]|jgi:RNA polymerase sigma factor (TIGR02999 family)
MTDVTRILTAIEQGDARAANELLPLIYEELRLLASQKMAQEKPGQTLQATALVHEAYLRLVEAKDQNWSSRGHFFKAAAEAMRRILIDNARRKKSLRAGGERQRIDADDANLWGLTLSDESTSEYLLALDDALNRLSKSDPRNAELVKLHYFAGLSLDQVAKIQGISRRTAARWWTYARAWLHREISGEEEPDLRHCPS